MKGSLAPRIFCAGQHVRGIDVECVVAAETLVGAVFRIFQRELDGVATGGCLDLSALLEARIERVIIGQCCYPTGSLSGSSRGFLFPRAQTISSPVHVWRAWLR